MKDKIMSFEKKYLHLTEKPDLAPVVYTKTFTFGSCNNLCGETKQQNIDCSCNKSCELVGTCCSDYTACESLWDKNKSSQYKDCSYNNIGCELCELNVFQDFVCKKCSGEYYLRNGKCVRNCEATDKIVEKNRICMDTTSK